jgi:hypothetical protein
VIQWEIRHGISLGERAAGCDVCRGRQDGKEQRLIGKSLFQGPQKGTGGKSLTDRRRVEPQRLPVAEALLDLVREEPEALAQPQPVTGPEQQSKPGEGEGRDGEGSEGEVIEEECRVLSAEC